MENFAFEYLIGLKLVKPNPPKSLCEYSDLIKYMEKEFNRINEKSANPKNMNIREINENTVILNLESQTELSIPGKALRSFSQLLLSNVEFAENFIFRKQLFVSFDVANSTNIVDSKAHISADDIEDAIFLNALINYFLKKKDQVSVSYMQKRKAIDKMKILAYETGILTLENNK